MFNRYSLDRFKKAQSIEPFSVNAGVAAPAPPPQAKPPLPATELPKSSPPVTAQPQPQSRSQPQLLQTASASEPPVAAVSVHSTGIGNGQSNWQPPDWAVEPRPGVYWLEVVKDGEVLDRIPLDRRRHIFGRQIVTCDFVLDHPSVSRQHAAVVQHKNGSIFIIDLGSVHGTFVANERLTKDNPVELEVGQSLRFAASTRSYVLRKGVPQAPQQLPVNLVLPPPPDQSDEEAVVAYNTILNRLNVAGTYNDMTNESRMGDSNTRGKVGDPEAEMVRKKARRSRVTFRDLYDGVLVEVVGVSDGADVSTEPGPVGVKEGSLVGKYESLVQVTVIPKGQEDAKSKAESTTPKGVSQKLQQYLEKVKSPSKAGLYGDLYGDSFSGQVGASWANIAKGGCETNPGSANRSEQDKNLNGGTENMSSMGNTEKQDAMHKLMQPRLDSAFENEDLFGDDDEET
eukprot:c28360_g2_i1 orf=245-1612(+)